MTGRTGAHAARGPRRRLLIVLGVLLLVIAVAAGTAVQAQIAAKQAPAGPIQPVRSCASIADSDLSTLKGASATVVSASTVTARGNTLGTYAACRITGIIAPQTQFSISLPLTTYTGRYLQLGCSGLCGTNTLAAPLASYGCQPVTNGEFAEATNNQGHVGGEFDGQWAADKELRAVFGYRSEHQLALVSKRIIGLYYGDGPTRSYYDGCSNGGREGLMEAQRYPDDFDGVLAGAPALLFNELAGFYENWNERANTGKGRTPVLKLSDLAPLHAAVVAACDAEDGTADGLISDPLACDWDPKSIVCADGQTSSAKQFCLSAAQVTTVEKLYSGPRDSVGILLYPGWQTRGSELNWAGWIVPTSGDMTTTYAYALANAWLKYMGYPDVRTDIKDTAIDFTRDQFAQLTSFNDSIYNATDPDLRAFKARGGKLLMYHGWADPAIPATSTIAYYQAMTKEMGGAAATNSFARLFLLPGVGHCTGGDGPDQFNGLGALVDWRERGTAPTELFTTKLDGTKVVSTRPVYQYPLIAVKNANQPAAMAGSYSARRLPTASVDAATVPWAGSFTPGTQRVCQWSGYSFVCRAGKQER